MTAGTAAFQETCGPTTSSHLTFRGDVPTMTNFTVCFRLKLLQLRDENVIISYSIPDFDNEFILSQFLCRC
jgi:hypothetical protein